MTSHQDLLALFAELSLVLAGFVGVVSAFSGRDRVHGPADLVRLRHVLGCAATVLAGCLAYYTSEAGGLSVSSSLGVAGIAAAVVAVVSKSATFKPTWQYFGTAESTTERWALVVGWGTTFASVLLFVSAASLDEKLFPMVGGFSLELLSGLWIFSRLITRSS